MTWQKSARVLGAGLDPTTPAVLDLLDAKLDSDDWAQVVGATTTIEYGGVVLKYPVGYLVSTTALLAGRKGAFGGIKTIAVPAASIKSYGRSSYRAALDI